jgi:hypothetical protein
MNRAICPECRSTDVAPDDPREDLIDCHHCGIWWEPGHPHNQVDSPCFGKQCNGCTACYGTCLERTALCPRSSSAMTRCWISCTE